MKKLVALALVLVFAVPASAATDRIVATQDWWPVYSPDSTHIAFTRVAGRTFQLLVTDAAAHRSVLIGRSLSQLHPTWSADGRLAYASGGVLYVVNANGTGKHRYVAPAKSFSPAWRPGSEDLAYLTTHGAVNTDLWVGAALWAKDAIGVPSWSPDGHRLAFAREDGVYVATGPRTETKIAATAGEPGSPVFSPDGASIAYSAGGRVYVAAADGSSRALVAGPFADVGPPAWGPTNDVLAYSVRGGLEISTNEPTWHSSPAVRAAVGPGASFAPGNPHSDVLVYSGPRASCPGHLSIRQYGSAQAITGSCTIAGTAGPDTIEGTPQAGDAIVAGAGSDRIHANDGHTDRVNCGPGRDTVWADRLDKLTGCEIVHR